MTEDTILQDIERLAKEVMVVNGCHRPQLIIQKPDDALEIIALIMESASQKQLAIEVMRKHVIEVKAKRYWVIMDAKLTSFDEKTNEVKNRKEVLIIQEFAKDLKDKIIVNNYHRDGKKIVWDKRECNPYPDAYSHWNFYKEDVMDEVLNNKFKMEDKDETD